MENTVGRDRRVLIAGGGIGGLAAGAALANLGFRVTILEQAEDFKEVGAGVQIAPNGVRALGTLIGDAAHPMLQYMAQGACQALEDVVRLVDEVQAQPDDIPAAFSAYAEGRYRRTARVQFSARQLIEVCQVGGVMAEVRRSYFSQRSDEQKFESLAWLYSDRAGEKFQ